MGDPRTEANRATALRFIEQVGQGVLDESLLADDAQWWIPGLGTVSRKDFLGFMQGFRSLCASPVVMTIEGVTAEGDRVAIEARAEAELKDGTRYCNTYHFLLEFDAGKVRLAKEYNDTRHSTETVGALLLRGSRPGETGEER